MKFNELFLSFANAAGPDGSRPELSDMFLNSKVVVIHPDIKEFQVISENICNIDRVWFDDGVFYIELVT